MEYKEKKEEIWLSAMKKPLYQQKCQKGNMTTQWRNQNVRLHSDCGPNSDGQMELP